MNLNAINKDSAVLPAIVKLYDSHKLYELANDKKPLARAELSNAITELLDMDVSPTEGELIADILISLMRQAERDLCEALSERLSIVPDVPLRLALHIANEDINIAKPFLQNSDVFSDLDLIYIIKSQGPDYWQAIARRKTMNDQIINSLASTKDNGTVQNLTENFNIVLPETAMSIISDMAQNSDALAKPLLQRQEISKEIVSKLYTYVGQELKNFISQNFHVNTDSLLKTVDEVVVEFVEETKASPYTPTPSMLRAAQRHKEQGLLTVKMILSTLRRGQMQAFVAQLCLYTDLKPKVIEEVLQQKNGQGLAVICKAMEIEKPDFVTMFLLTNRMREDGRYVDTMDMSKAVHYYKRVDIETARRILRSSKRI